MIKDTRIPNLHGFYMERQYLSAILLEAMALFHFLGKVLPHGVKSWHFSIPLHIQQQLLGYICQFPNLPPDSGP